ncbi:hypothetical protein WJ59_09530 [Burkholderia gladioli]|uniref:hypothetical protein n=1 Tax=Burkholderia gladioli TaxID=28095 RepID=UPI00050F66C5|nr:hypothetical protein [Burkholderia gladioli]AYQ92119.1 hypothetical protein EDD84_33295 [Burkholderia gladioli]KGE09044.1 hypothetical protein LA03_18000 [Burkholderia gladioli]KVM70773.1 hypothetical protein WJ59_09530 [Burkholderia gladioli]
MRMSKWISLSMLAVSMSAMAGGWPERWIDHEPTHWRNQNAEAADQAAPERQAKREPVPVPGDSSITVTQSLSRSGAPASPPLP